MLQQLRRSCADLEISDADNENQGVNNSTATANASLEGNGELYHYKTQAMISNVSTECIVEQSTTHSHYGNSCSLVDMLYDAVTREDSRYLLTTHPSVVGTAWLRIECRGHISEAVCGTLYNPFITLECDRSSTTFQVFFSTNL